MLFAWDDEKAWFRGWREFQNDPTVLAAFAAQRTQFGRTLFGANDTFLLEPATYALPFASLRTRNS